LQPSCPSGRRESCPGRDVRQIMSITISGDIPSILRAKAPSASRASRSIVSRRTSRQAAWGRYGSRLPRLTAMTSWPSSTRRGTRYPPTWPVAPMTTTLIFSHQSPHHRMNRPPFTSMVSPVRKSFSIRNRTAFAISTGRPLRSTGVFFLKLSIRAGVE
jgi:hypothetical protein